MKAIQVELTLEKPCWCIKELLTQGIYEFFATVQPLWNQEWRLHG